MSTVPREGEEGLGKVNLLDKNKWCNCAIYCTVAAEGKTRFIPEIRIPMTSVFPETVRFAGLVPVENTSTKQERQPCKAGLVTKCPRLRMRR